MLIWDIETDPESPSYDDLLMDARCIAETIAEADGDDIAWGESTLVEVLGEEEALELITSARKLRQARVDPAGAATRYRFALTLTQRREATRRGDSEGTAYWGGLRIW